MKRKYGLRGRGDYSLNVPFTNKKYVYKGDTPFATVGKTIGSTFGYPSVGEGVGHVVGRLFGSGDYKMGVTPNSNSIWNSTQTPKFAARGRGNIITNREYIGDVFSASTGSGAPFNVTSYPINPGLASVFPWLSTLAQNYEQYKIHGMIFEFKSTLGDNSGVQNVGTVIMGTEYNVTAPSFVNKQVMENSEFAQSAKSVSSQIHGIECAGKEHPMKVAYVRTGALTADVVSKGDNLKWYDFANFQIATTGFSTASQNIGELWVSYQVEFFKPQIPSNIGGAVQTGHLYRTGAGTAGGTNNYMGTTVGYSSGTIPIVASGSPTNTIIISNLYIGNSYTVTFMWVGGATGFVAPTYSAITGGTTKNLYINAAAPTAVGGTGGAAVTQASSEIALLATASVVSFSFTAGTVPSTSGVDIIVRGIDNGTI